MEVELGVAAMTLEDWAVNEQTVMRVAAAWSFDPTTLHLVGSRVHMGLCGTVPAKLRPASLVAG